MSRRMMLAAGTTVTVPDPGTGGPSGDAALFAAAIAQVASTGGMVVFSGSYTVNAPIVIPAGVWLVGTGWKGSQIKLANGANCDVIKSDPNNPVKFAGLADFFIDGNRGHNTVGHAVNFNNPKPDKSNGECSVNVIDTVLVHHAPVDAFHMQEGQVESRLFNCYSFSAGRHGFYFSGSDYWLTDCTAGESGSDGFVLMGMGARMSGCKSWWSGRQGDPGVIGNPGPGNGTAAGYRFAIENAQVVNCEAQDSSGPGAAISGYSGRIALHLDGNNAAGMGSTGYLFDVGYATKMQIDINVGYGTARAVAPYVLSLGGQTSGCLIDIWNGATGNALYRPGSSAVGNNTIRALGTYA